MQNNINLSYSEKLKTIKNIHKQETKAIILVLTTIWTYNGSCDGKSQGKYPSFSKYEVNKKLKSIIDPILVPLQDRPQ